MGGQYSRGSSSGPHTVREDGQTLLRCHLGSNPGSDPPFAPTPIHPLGANFLWNNTVLGTYGRGPG
eukprot:13389327-Heterocapsa_arctica.AAC.1